MVATSSGWFDNYILYGGAALVAGVRTRYPEVIRLASKVKDVRDEKNIFWKQK